MDPMGVNSEDSSRTRIILLMTGSGTQLNLTLV